MIFIKKIPGMSAFILIYGSELPVEYPFLFRNFDIIPEIRKREFVFHVITKRWSLNKAKLTELPNVLNELLNYSLNY